jgi:hypothetical protein
MPNLLLQPEEFGYRLVHSVNGSPSRDAGYFDTVAVWASIETGEHFYFHDTGWPTAVPFEALTPDMLIPLVGKANVALEPIRELLEKMKMKTTHRVLHVGKIRASLARHLLAKKITAE